MYEEKGPVTAVLMVGTFAGFYLSMMLSFVFDLLLLPVKFVVAFFDFSTP